MALAGAWLLSPSPERPFKIPLFRARSTTGISLISYVGVPHGVELNGAQLFYTHVHLHAGPAAVCRYLPELIQSVQEGTIHPGKVFDLELPLEQGAEGYRAMDERRAIKTLLCPWARLPRTRRHHADVDDGSEPSWQLDERIQRVL